MTNNLKSLRQTNDFGHIIRGETNIKNLWKARDTIVHALNSLRIMLLVKEDNQEKRGFNLIIINLEKGLRKINKSLGIKNE